MCAARPRYTVLGLNADKPSASSATSPAWKCESLSPCAPYSDCLPELCIESGRFTTKNKNVNVK